MKSSLSALDIHYLMEEFQVLIGSKLDKLYQPLKREFLFQFHKTGEGKLMLKVLLGEKIFISEFKRENPEMKQGFCPAARKMLLNTRLREIKQIGFERVIELVFEGKERKYHFIAELFGKGNAVLTDEDDKILLCVERKSWKDREIKPKVKYIKPSKGYNFLELKESDLKKLIKDTKRENIVKTLAIDLGLGGVYSEEVCLIAGIEKEKTELSPKEIKSLFKTLETLRKNKLSPVKIKDGEKVVDIVPFKLKQYEKLKSEPIKTFSKGLDEVYTEKEITEIGEEKSGKKNKEMNRIKHTIDLQEKQLASLEKGVEENKRKGELIYEKYQIVDDLLKQIKEARKKMSWKEIKEKLKENKKISNIIKKIDEKEGKITIDI